ncbi:MAG: LPD38 domain-containing protein [Desulfobacteraceae bacterium]
MPIVSIPDKDMRIRFPDDMSPEAIEQAIREQVYGGHVLPETRKIAQGLQEEEERARERERSLFSQQPRTEPPDLGGVREQDEQIRDIASQLPREATVSDAVEYASYVPYLATKALHGLSGWVFEPFQGIPTDKMSPVQKATVEALGGAEDVLETATEYWKKATGGKDIKIPNATIGRNEDGSLAIKPAEPISLRETLGTTAEFAGEVMGPIKGALAAGHEAAELTAKYARPFYRSIMRGMVGGALLGEGKKDETLQNMALFGVFEPLAYSIGKVPEIPRMIKESTPWRRMNIKERGLVLQSLDDMIWKNPEMSEAEILKRWNNPQWRKEALERRVTPLSEAEGRPDAGAPVVRTAETGIKKGVAEKTGEAMPPAASSRVTVPATEAPTTRIPTGPTIEAEAPPYSYERMGYTVTQTRDTKKDAQTRWKVDMSEDLKNDLLAEIELVKQAEAGTRIKTGEGLDEEWIAQASTFPDWFKNQGWTKKQAVKAMEKAVNGEELGINESRVVEAALDYINETYYNNYIGALKNAGYSESDIRRAARVSLPAEIEKIEAEVAKAERGARDVPSEEEFEPWEAREQFGLFGGKPEEPILTPEKETPHEKAARLEREGFIKRTKSQKPKTKFPEEGIKPPTGGKQQSLFTPTDEQKQTGLFDQEPFSEGTETPNQEQPAYDVRPEKQQPEIKLSRPKRLPGAPRMHYRSTGRIKAAGNRVQDTSEVASLLASLRKRPSETFYSVAVDKDGTILEINEHSIGGRSGAYVIPDIVVGRAVRLPGVHKAYFAHNHPSTVTDASLADKELSKDLDRLAGMAGLETAHLILGGNRYARVEGGAPQQIKPVLRKTTLPKVSRRAGRAYRPQETTISSPDKAEEFFKDHFRKENGVLLLDNQNKPLAFVPFVKGRSMRQTTIDILGTAEDVNAARMIGKIKKDAEVVRDYVAALKAKGLGTLQYLDTIADGKSLDIPVKYSAKGVDQKLGAEGPGEMFSPKLPGTSRRAISINEAFTPIPEGKRRSAILKKASKALEVPIRTGKFRTQRGALQAAGIYKPGPEVIRLAKANDLETAIHEIGHHIEDLLGLPEEMPPQVQAMAYEGADDVDREGFAEFLRYYVTAPQAAREGAPEFYEKFEQALEGQPDVQDIITQARNAWNVWQQSPSVAKVHSFIQRGGTERAMPTMSRVYTTVKDALHPLRQAVKAAEKKGATVTTTENPYLMARLTRGWARKAEQYLKYQPFQYDPQKGVEFSGKSLSSILKPIEKAGKTELLDTYLIAKRALHDPRIQEGFSGILSVNDFRQTVKELEPEFKETAEDLYEYSDQLLTFLTDSGRISDKTAEAIRSKNLFYAPLYRVMDWEAPLGGLSSKRFSNLFNPVKRLKGSSRDIYSPTESLVYNTFVTINAAERNRVGNALRKLADKPGMGAVIERIPARMKPVQMSMGEALKSLTSGISDPVEKKSLKDTLSDFPEDILQQMVTAFRPNFTPKQNEALFYRDGDPVLYEISPDLARAIGNINATDVGILTRAMSYPAKWLRAGATTFSPEFAIRNPIRDQMTAYIQTKYGFKPGYDILRGLYHMMGKTDLWQRFNASGAAHSAIVSLDRNYISKNLKDMLRKGSVKGMVRHPLELLQAVSEYTEEATRVGEFARGIKKEGGSYEALLKAGIAGREVSLDFARQGEAWARSANLISAFWNARIEGLDKMGRTFKENPVKAFAKAFLGVTLPSVLLWYSQKDDPYYQELPAWRKTLCWNFVLHNEDGTLKHVISIPKPFEYGLIFGSIPESALDWAYSEDPGAFNETMESVGKTFSLFPIPTGLVPLGEWWANKSWFFDRPIVSRGKEDLEPVLQYSEHTAEVTKLIAEMMDRVPGLREIASPAKIENLIRGYTGGSGRLGMEAGDWLIKTLGIVDTSPDPEMTLSDIPGIRGFIGRFPSANTRSIETFYNQYTEMSRKWESAKQRTGIRGTGVQVEAPRKLQEYRKIAKALSLLRKMADQTHRTKGLDPEAKREALDNIYFCMANVARSALGKAANLKPKKRNTK